MTADERPVNALGGLTGSEWLEMRRAAIGGWQTHTSAALRKEIEARLIATINARQNIKERTMTTKKIGIVLDVSTDSEIDRLTLRQVMNEALIALVDIGHVSFIGEHTEPLATKTFTRQDFADRLQHHIAVGDVDLPELFADRVIDSIRPQDVARLGRIDEDDLAAITLILSAAIARVTGNDHG